MLSDRVWKALCITGDRLIVNRIPVTVSHLRNENYLPERGQIIVFKNPRFASGLGDEYIVKRVIAFPGEHVKLKDGIFTVYNGDNPNGFNPDDLIKTKDEIIGPTSGSYDDVVPEGDLFVTGDHRVGSFSSDSRNNLGTIPLYDVVGPVLIRVFPFTQIRFF